MKDAISRTDRWCRCSWQWILFLSDSFLLPFMTFWGQGCVGVRWQMAGVAVSTEASRNEPLKVCGVVWWGGSERSRHSISGNFQRPLKEDKRPPK